MRTLIIGATGGSGRAAVISALARGDEVTAFSRSASRLGIDHPRLRTIDGDATSAADVDAAVRGQDAVIVTLGITENPLLVRLLGARRTADDVRSVGTRTCIDAMRRHGVRRLVVQTTYGVGATRDRLRWADRLLFATLLRPQIADSEVQDALVAASDLDWVLVQPVHLAGDGGDADEAPAAHASTDGEVGAMSVSRGSVGRFLVDATGRDDIVRRSVALSGQPTALQAA